MRRSERSATSRRNAQHSSADFNHGRGSARIILVVVFDSPPDGLWVFTDPKLVVFSTDCCQRELSFELVRWRAAPGHLLSPATVGFPPAHLSAATTPASFDENTTRKAFAALPVWFTVDVGRDDRGSQARCRRDNQGEMALFPNRILRHL